MPVNSRIATKGSTARASRVVLGEDMGISTVERLHRTLLKCAAREANVFINAERVNRIDTTSLQLLLAFVRHVKSNGYTVTWKNPSAAIKRAADLIGLNNYLGLDADTK